MSCLLHPDGHGITSVALGSSSEWVADTSLITKHFIDRGSLQDTDSKSSGRRGQDRAIRAPLETTRYFD